MEPYSCSLRHGPDGRITQKTETVAGRAVTWKYDYDSAGRMTEAYLDGRMICQCSYDRQGRRQQDYFPASHGGQVRNYGYTMDDRLQSAGNNGYTHDKTTGARSIWNHQGQYTTYDYSPDGRLLRAEQEFAGRVFEFDHDEDGRRQAKYENERLVEAYAWQDLIRLAGFHDGEHGFRFLYEDDETRTPYAMQREDGAVAYLYYDQVGSLRVVADMQGNVIKEVLYDPFGGIIEDTNPDLCIPIGFAGGLHDRDLGFVRFGWRDYDVYTGRWTAPDPIGDGGGDSDWYGYCLDDPVSMNDPFGLLAFLLPFAAGMAGATAIAGTGAYGAAKVTDWAGKKTDKNYGKDKPTATEGVNDAMDKVIKINTGIVGAAGAAKATPALAGAAMRHPDKLAAGSKGAADLASGWFDPGPPPPSVPGHAGSGAKWIYNNTKNKK